MERLHKTILESEVIELIGVKSGGSYLDLTFGEGGHTQAVLRAGGRVLGLDRDREALETYQKSGGERLNPALRLVHGTMGQFAMESDELFDGVIADLGVSTRQILSEERGFSFQGAGPLDMRMDSTSGESLRDLLGRVSEEELANGLYRYGEIHGSRKLAARIFHEFKQRRLNTTADLVRLAPGRIIPGKSHPATQLFMALRMMVNRELEEIEFSFPKIFERMTPGARFCVITFHSVEDRLVKGIFKMLSGQCVCASDPCRCARRKLGELVLRKPMIASDAELAMNPRSRSAKLRCIEKLPV